MPIESPKRASPLAVLTEQILANRPPAVKPARKIKVGFVEIGNSFGGGLNSVGQRYLPQSYGMLVSYAQKHLTYAGDYEFQLPNFQEMRIEEASEILSECDTVGFSSSLWNEQKNLAIAEDYKRRNPNGVVVFGGQQVPDSKKQFRRNRTVELNPDELKRKRIHFTEDFHRAYPFIDLACHGEGERIFKIILEQMAIDGCRDKSTIPQISFLDQGGNFQFNVKLERMTDAELAQTGSPFTSGLFDKIMDAYPEQKWIALLETDRGCPYTCSYCEWGGATEDKVYKFSLEQSYANIMWQGEHHIPYVFVCNANFGLPKEDVQIAEFFAEAAAKYGYPQSVSVQNAKNPKPHSIQALKVLGKAGIHKATVMSQQSTNPPTLKAVRRDNMDMSEYYKIQKELAAAGLDTLTDLILGMPEETYESTLQAICTLIENGQHNRIQFNNLSALRNTEMGNPEYQEHYGYKIVRAKIINYHGKKNSSISGIEEYQDLVLGTNTMPPEEWVKTRALCHMVNLIYFDKLQQIPIITLRHAYQIPYYQTFKTTMENSRQPKEYPIFSEALQYFENHAREMQNGGEEMAYSREALGIWWYPDENFFTKLVRENKLAGFYEEAEKNLTSCLGYQPMTDMLSEAIKLNQVLIKQPFQTTDLELTLSYNVWELYRAVLRGSTVPVMPGRYYYTIDRTTRDERGTNWWGSWEEWYEKMVWYCNRRGAYLYGNVNPHQEIAGHH